MVKELTLRLIIIYIDNVQMSLCVWVCISVCMFE